MIWQQYRKTAVGMQVIIALITGGAYLTMYRSLAPALTLFAILQVGAVLGAYWGVRLKKRA